ncbi:MAG: hypothetical protein RI965_455 [Bacteroidota bacterium]
MRPIWAISLLLLHLFNMGGYQLLFKHFEEVSNTRLVAKIDHQDYDEKNLLEIKVPIHLPYQLDWADYERVDGEIVLEGVHYNYVKRKLVNDTMTFLCLPNTEKTQIHHARETFYSLVNDLQQETSNQESGSVPPTSKPIKFNVSEFDQDAVVFELNQFNQTKRADFLLFGSVLADNYMPAIERPPAAIA